MHEREANVWYVAGGLTDGYLRSNKIRLNKKPRYSMLQKICDLLTWIFDAAIVYAGYISQHYPMYPMYPTSANSSRTEFSNGVQSNVMNSDLFASRSNLLRPEELILKGSSPVSTQQCSDVVWRQETSSDWCVLAATRRFSRDL
jgi:hypothetical protein